MKLKPFNEEVEVEEVRVLPAALRSILEETGIVPTTEREVNLHNLRKTFNDNGASLGDVSKTVGQMMRAADTDGGRLKAAEMALKVHGIFSEIDEKKIPQIVINIQGSENKTLINLVCPL